MSVFLRVLIYIKSVKIRPMLQRYAIHFALIFLFAFTQMGVATHEISHITDASQHSQQDPKSQSKHTTTEQCEQCISYAKVANGLQLSAFVIPVISADSTAAVNHFSSFQSRSSNAYSARAPPQIASI
jgi:type II secretory pathway component PulL